MSRINYPDFHRRRIEVWLVHETTSALAKYLDQSRRASLGLTKIAAHLASNPLSADIEALASAALGMESLG